MKLVILVACAFLAVALAAPAVESVEPIPIVRSSYESKPDGGYSYGYESADGSQRQEDGQLVEALDEENKPHQVVVVRGSYSYTDPEGKVQTITYEADQDGFRADGDSIPKVPVARK